MKILTTEDKAIDTDGISDGKNIHYGVLDFTKTKTPDFFFKPLVFVNVCQDSAAHLTIGGYDVILPFRWNVLVFNGNMIEYISIEDMTGRLMDVVCLNPISGFRPMPMKARVNGISYDASFSIPNLDRKHLLVTPIEPKEDSPLCILAGETSCRVPENLDVGMIW